MFRNALLLMQEPHVAWHWKRHHALALCQLAVFFLAAESERLLRLRMMVRGLVHGVQRRTGPPV
jgi:hypothetical protein